MKKQEITSSISAEALKALCAMYDENSGTYPEHEYEGFARYTFFLDLWNSVRAKGEKNPLIVNKWGTVKRFCCKELEAVIDYCAIEIFEDYETKKLSASLKCETMTEMSFFDICPYCKAKIFVQCDSNVWAEFKFK